MVWQNVVVNTGGDKIFDPPLDAIYVTVAANGSGDAMDVYVNDVAVAAITATTLNATGLKLDGLGHITRINNTGDSLRYIGIRKLPSSTFGAINDT